MNSPDNVICVILAGGKGKRMASTGSHKVCFPILGEPAIVRAINTYKATGLKNFMVVVGQMAEQVIATTATAHPEVSFVYQPQARGTGHAATVAVESLAAQGFNGTVMIVMGDKITRPDIVRELLERFEDSAADVVISTLEKTPESTAGRVITDGENRVLGIVELKDIQQARRKKKKLNVAGKQLTGLQVENRGKTLNASMYAFRFAPLREALKKLRSDNSQGELYLTDTVEYLAATGRKVESMLVDNPDDLMAYNTPAELLAIEQVVAAREKPKRVQLKPGKKIPRTKLKPAGEWLDILNGNSERLQRKLKRIYGADQPLVNERRKELLRLVKGFIKRYGKERPMILCRAPGRINLMGRHVDHRGGYVNVMAISREVLLAAAPRDDDAVSLQNLDPARFPAREFRIWDLVGEASWADWMDFLGSQNVEGLLHSYPGDWSHYARAPLLRLQHECRHMRLKGMDCVVSGNIPMGAGLSSSSALVVAFAEAAVALNGLDVAMNDFIDLCGEGEWFVGSRGGSADHAAIRTGRRGYISRIGFHPFRQEGEIRFPSDLRVVIAYSGSKAVKSTSARDVFNQRVACYEVAQLLLRRLWPAAASAEHLRDLVPDKLQVGHGEIYRALTRLPLKPTRQQLKQIVPEEDHEKLDRIFSTHRNLGGYDLRGVALYGISECVRSEKFAEVLGNRDIENVARFMRISHDGDRRFKFNGPDKAAKHSVSMTDKTMLGLARREADLARQCGRYTCSTEAIDMLVDIASSVEGVVGAQIAGAGLGGCMMILVQEKALTKLRAKLRKEFYTPKKLPFDVYTCLPVEGAGLLSL